ncbi:hypothetical protein Y1Q_0002489 [Alligator mississippiensis]|uniref:Uncharacterized protein n=1 Tax=Alligator mississippiensis TaxID=8496 RepID=A0A151NBP0_ALLMI|nr:hypothetical protein Y1Q_0002489 [Alligator mississippiensis]
MGESASSSLHSRSRPTGGQKELIANWLQPEGLIIPASVSLAWLRVLSLGRCGNYQRLRRTVLQKIACNWKEPIFFLLPMAALKLGYQPGLVLLIKPHRKMEIMTWTSFANLFEIY